MMFRITHEWSNWATYLIMDGIQYQERHCFECGKVEQREVS